jgi:amino acid transporter
MHILKLLFHGWLYVNAAWTTSALISVILIVWADQIVQHEPFVCPCKVKITAKTPKCLDENPSKSPLWLVIVAVVFIVQYFGIEAVKLAYEVTQHKKKCLVYQVKTPFDER